MSPHLFARVLIGCAFWCDLSMAAPALVRAQECVTCRTEDCPMKEGVAEWCGKRRDPMAPRQPRRVTVPPTVTPPVKLPRTAPALPDCLPGMVFIPGGTLLRDGARVPIAGLCIDATETTVAAWRLCQETHACAAVPEEAGCNADPRHDEHPVNCVTREQAATFCASRGARLPSDAEWEWAARGDDARSYPWGEALPGGELCWDGAGDGFGRGERTGTCPVGSFPTSDTPTGLRDLAGNVAEWTLGDKPSEWLLRGGSWGSVRAEGVSALRAVVLRDAGAFRSRYVGFRCAATPASIQRGLP